MGDGSSKAFTCDSRELQMDAAAAVASRSMHDNSTL
jgi:hypothetical protein